MFQNLGKDLKQLWKAYKMTDVLICNICENVQQMFTDLH